MTDTSKRVEYNAEASGSRSNTAVKGVGATATTTTAQGGNGAGPSKQVFDVREEPGKPRECVLIWDDVAQVSVFLLASALGAICFPRWECTMGMGEGGEA